MAEKKLSFKHIRSFWKKRAKRILHYLKPYWKLWLWLFFIGIIFTLLSLVSPLVVKILIDEVFINKNLQLLNLIMVILIGVTIFSTLVGIYSTYMGSWLGQRIVFDIRADLFKHLESLDLNFFSKKRVGDILSRIQTDVGSFLDFISIIFDTVIINFFMAIFILIIALFLDWRLTLISLTAIPFFVLIQRYYGIKIRKQTKLIRRQSASFLSFLQERLAFVTR
ncbi:MAG: ABC transporter ATP-binding protein, partial [Bacteroidetes bacterium]|nr:ABC transporter ATP-binding protein [Bacteroidota bacterium]